MTHLSIHLALPLLAALLVSGTATAAAPAKHPPAKAAPAKPKDVNGWGLVTWGMTHKQVLTAYPKAHEYELGTPPHVRYLFGLESLRLAGCTYAVDFEMKRNALRRVTLYGQEASKECGEGIDALLVKQLGAPAERAKAKDNLSAEAVWKAGRTHVTLRRGLGAAAKKAPPVVEYTPK
ncbi:MAG: hypothetical protein PW843_17305 [Azospirillaceae bacterium]|nr:hypothetical protein [Azospirillaceae bacterium]